MMRERQDLQFLFLTKRIERFAACMPADWGDGYENERWDVPLKIRRWQTIGLRFSRNCRLSIRILSASL